MELYSICTNGVFVPKLQEFLQLYKDNNCKPQQPLFSLEESNHVLHVVRQLPPPGQRRSKEALEQMQVVKDVEYPHLCAQLGYKVGGSPDNFVKTYFYQESAGTVYLTIGGKFYPPIEQIRGAFLRFAHIEDIGDGLQIPQVEFDGAVTDFLVSCGTGKQTLHLLIDGKQPKLPQHVRARLASAASSGIVPASRPALGNGIVPALGNRPPQAPPINNITLPPMPEAQSLRALQSLLSNPTGSGPPPVMNFNFGSSSVYVGAVTNNNGTGDDSQQRHNELLAAIQAKNSRAGSGAGGGGGDDDDDVQQRHNELLSAIQAVPQQTTEAVKENTDQQIQQSTRKLRKDFQGDFDTTIKNAVDECLNGKVGQDLQDRFDSEHQVESPPRKPDGSPTAVSPNTRDRIAHEFVTAGKPKDIIEAMMMTIAPGTLVDGVKEQFHNLLRVTREIQDGTLVVPMVNENGLDGLLSRVDKDNKLYKLMGDRVHLHRDCFVLVPEQVEDGDLVGSEMLRKQRLPCVSHQSLCLVYANKEEGEVEIEFHSFTAKDSELAINLVVKTVFSEPDLVKCVVSGSMDKISSLSSNTIKEISSLETRILHFHGCDLDYQQSEALSTSKGSIILDECLFDEERLFSGLNLTIAFLRCSVAFDVLTKAVSNGTVTALMLQKLDLGSWHNPKHDSETARKHVSDLKLLVAAATASGCTLCLSEITAGGDSVKSKFDKDDFDDSIWNDKASIDYIHELGKLSSKRQYNAKVTRMAEKADGNVVAEPIMLLEGPKGRTIEKMPDATLRFTNYGEDFVLAIDAEHELLNCTVKLLEHGGLLYVYNDHTTKRAKVPVSATAAKFWCDNCARQQSCPSKH